MSIENAEEPPWLRELDHTGDVGFEVEAAILPALFERAAVAMFRVVVDLAGVRAARKRTITVEAQDREALLVRWLSELNYLHATEGWIFVDFSVTSLNNHRLVAVVRGEPYDAERHVLHTEIKAVTYHDLHIRREDDGWQARVILDL